MEETAFLSSPSFPLLPPHLPCKPLRSCLSPTRFRSIDVASTPSLPPSSSAMSSRSTSFSSSTSCDTQWRRSKSVRWKGEEGEEGDREGCAVTSYYATWSATEYDRTPLEPPSEGERACVLPERGSRCLSPRNFFSTSLFEEPDEVEEGLPESLVLPTSPDESDQEEQAEEAEASDEDREWEECMARRRMMFASMRRHSDGDEDRLGFDGYTSLSSTLAELLKSVGCEGASTPLEGFEALPAHAHEDEGAGLAMKAFRIGMAMRTPELCSSGSSEEGSVLASPAMGEIPCIVIAEMQGKR